MNPYTGEIHSSALIKEMLEDPHTAAEMRRRLTECVPMKIEPTKTQLARKPPKVGRNELCPCGSGAKFKRCCLRVGVGNESSRRQ